MTHPATDQATDAVGLLGGAGLTGADRPDRLIGHDHPQRVDAFEPLFDLAMNHPFGLAGLALIKALPHAQDRDQAGALGRAGAQIDLLVGFAIIFARLAVTHDRMADAVLDQHRRRDHAGVGAALLPVHVLTGNRHTGPLQVAAEGGNRCEGGRQHHLAIAGQIGDQGTEDRSEVPRLGAGHVHLPIPRDDGPAHRRHPQTISPG